MARVSGTTCINNNLVSAFPSLFAAFISNELYPFFDRLKLYGPQDNREFPRELSDGPGHHFLHVFSSEMDRNTLSDEELTRTTLETARLPGIKM
jgi:hypothetical protein